MDNFEYPGVRIEMNALIDKMATPLKLDISTNDVITPREIEYDYNLLIEDRKINLWAYNLETILAEKLETILSRNVLTTRLRDYYDVYTLMNIYKDENINIVRAVEDNYNVGIIEIFSPSDNKIKVYDLERTLCDILRGKGSDIQIVNAAMKKYASSKQKDINELMKYADKLRVKPKMLRYMEILL